MTVPFPRLVARTRNFTLGQPRTPTVSGDGRRVVFLRSSSGTDRVHALWVLDAETGAERCVADPRLLLTEPDDVPAAERALRERRRESSAGIVAYACNDGGTVAVFALSGRLFRLDLLAGSDPEEVPTAGPVLDPRPDPAGRRIAYVTDGALHVVDIDGTDRCLAAEEGATWGLPDFIAAEELGRFRGHWWSPDGTALLAARVDEAPVPVWHLSDPADPARPATAVRYPHAGAPNALVTLHVLPLDGGRVDVAWDRSAYEYLVTAAWPATSGPLLTVLSRDQRSSLVLTADPVTGETTEREARTDAAWVDTVPGTPEVLADGRLLTGADSRLFVDGRALTPPELYVRAVAGHVDGDLLVEGTAGEPECNHVWRVPVDGGEPERLTPERGYHSGRAGAETVLLVERGPDLPGARTTVHRDALEWTLRSFAEPPPYAPRPVLARVTERRLPSAVLYPAGHRAGDPLPVLMDPYAGPHHQEVVAYRGAWLQAQWWAEAGFAVVVVDGRGTPGISPEFERGVAGDLAGPVLDDQVDALHALAGEHPDLDLTRVGIRGWSFGGHLAALAVLRRPDVFHAAVAGAPVTDQRLYDTAYTERYLGLPQEHPDAYARSSAITFAAELTRPLMLIHGLADDNVVAAHTLRLSSALLAAGRPHEVLPLTGVTHMASDEVVAENLLLLQLDFLRRSLRLG
ncbi:MAG TPA: prolyl oligopeptidase family serine peptidase [Mycobacteriales bacterium]